MRGRVTPGNGQIVLKGPPRGNPPPRRQPVRMAPPPPREPPRRPRRKRGKLWTGLGVMVAATALTTLAIHASDNFSIPGSSLLAGAAKSGPSSHCPDDMVYVPNAGGGFCVDRYEDSVGPSCPHQEPSNEFDTQNDLGNADCKPVSKKDVKPWVYVPEQQALLLCARAGKRLPSNKEWYDAALGTPDGTGGGCALGRTGQASADNTGANGKCVSSYGAYDMVGNVWEWVDATVHDGKLDDHELPDEGYIAGVDSDGVPTDTGTSSQPAFGGDYFFIDKTGARGLFRGGFWSLDDRAGIYSVNATIPTSFVGNAVGFRCAKEAS